MRVQDINDGRPRACRQCGDPLVQIRRNRTRVYCSRACEAQWRRVPAVERFWGYVQKSPACWIWIGYRDEKNYGRFHPTRDVSPVIASRYSWELHFGPIPPGYQVQHLCNNPPCIRPDHLTVGLQKQNLEYMHACGRAAKGDRSFARLYPERLPRGENHKGSRLTDAAVRAIRMRRDRGDMIRALAKEFGVSDATICRVAKRQLWRHVV